jgi:hypothetical protein
MIAFPGRKLANPPTPLGVYGVYDVVLHGRV